MRLIPAVYSYMYIFVLQACTNVCKLLSISVCVWMSQCSTVWALCDEFGIGSRWFVDSSLYINKAASSRSTVSKLAARGEEKVRGFEAGLAPYWSYVTWGLTCTPVTIKTAVILSSSIILFPITDILKYVLFCIIVPFSILFIPSPFSTSLHSVLHLVSASILQFLNMFQGV